MYSRLYCMLHAIKNIEKSFFHILGLPPKELIPVFNTDVSIPFPNSMSIKDIIGDGVFYAVPKSRRTIEKRLKRKYGSPEYQLKIIEPLNNILVCKVCGHYHERGRLCGACYKRIETESKEIQAKIVETVKLEPIENEVIVLYEGENATAQPEEFWKGKRIIEMKKERPQWFSKNLMQKSTQESSDSTDLKPTDLA